MIAHEIQMYIIEEVAKHPFPDTAPAIVYLENRSNLGYKINSTVGRFDDWRLLVDVSKGVVLTQHEATTQTSKEGMDKMMYKGGAARIMLGFHKECWMLGFHKRDKEHEALIQCAPIKFTRDYNKDGLREGDVEYCDIIGLNQHYAKSKSGLAPLSVGQFSLACLVGRYKKSHSDFIRILKESEAYKNDPGFKFSTLIL